MGLFCMLNWVGRKIRRKFMVAQIIQNDELGLVLFAVLVPNFGTLSCVCV